MDTKRAVEKAFSMQTIFGKPIAKSIRKGLASTPSKEEVDMTVQLAKEFVAEPKPSLSSLRRLVTPADAEVLRANEGSWFEVKSRLTSDVAAKCQAPILRKNLHNWYGGSWSVTRDGLRLFARYNGNEAKAA